MKRPSRTCSRHWSLFKVSDLVDLEEKELQSVKVKTSRRGVKMEQMAGDAQEKFSGAISGLLQWLTVGALG